jgi:hypothetical protein
METIKNQNNRSQVESQKSSTAVSVLPEEAWITQLAQNEKAMLTDETINIRDEDHLKATEVQHQTEALMLSLRSRCSRLVEIFNQNKGQDSNALKQFKIAGSQYDFMLFRNTLKLVFSTPKSGIVDIYFSTYLTTNNTTDDANTVSGERLELTFGPFEEPYWALKGQRINLDFMLKKFLTDFVLLSCK